MKTSKAFMFFLILGIIIQACTPLSINPLYTKEQRLKKDELIGLWMEEDQPALYEITLQQDDTLSYKVVYTINLEDEKKFNTYEINLIELNGVTFIDLYPFENEYENQIDCHIINELFNWQLLPLHLFLRTEIDSDSIKLWQMDEEWFLEKHENGTEDLNFLLAVDDNKRRIIITEPTNVLQEFFAKYANDTLAFGSPDFLIKK